MEIINLTILKQALASDGATVKFILGDNVIIFFPGTQQHRDIKSHGLSYEDDYRGNAAAGLVTPNGVEIRFHKAYSDERIRAIWSKLRGLPDFSHTRLQHVTYQGREIDF